MEIYCFKLINYVTNKAGTFSFRQVLSRSHAPKLPHWNKLTLSRQ